MSVRMLVAKSISIISMVIFAPISHTLFLSSTRTSKICRCCSPSSCPNLPNHPLRAVRTSSKLIPLPIPLNSVYIVHTTTTSDGVSFVRLPSPSHPSLSLSTHSTAYPHQQQTPSNPPVSPSPKPSHSSPPTKPGGLSSPPRLPSPGPETPPTTARRRDTIYSPPACPGWRGGRCPVGRRSPGIRPSLRPRSSGSRSRRRAPRSTRCGGSRSWGWWSGGRGVV